MDGVLQKLLVVVGHLHVVAVAPPAVIICRYLKHWGTHSKQRRLCTTKTLLEKQFSWTEARSLAAQQPAAAAAASSSPEDVGVAAGVVVTSSSVLHLFTLPNVILAFSTWNKGISARMQHKGKVRGVLLLRSGSLQQHFTYFNRKSRGKFQGNKVS